MAKKMMRIKSAKASAPKNEKVAKPEKTTKPEKEGKLAFKKVGGGQAIEGARRGTIFHVPVEDLKVYPNWHPRYDARSEYAPAPEMVQNIKARGVQKPLRVEVVKAGQSPDAKGRVLEPGVYIVDGHQRRAWALAAREELRKEGEPADIDVPVWPINGDDEYLSTLSIALNRHVEDDPIVIAKKLRAVADRTQGDYERVAVQCGYSLSFVKQHVGLLDLARPVQSAVSRGDVAVSTAAQLVKLAPEEQVAAIEAAKDHVTEGDGRRRTKVTMAAVQKARAKDGSKAPSKKEIKARLVELDLMPSDPDYDLALEMVRKALVAELQWVLTGERPEDEEPTSEDADTSGAPSEDVGADAREPEPENTELDELAE